MGKPYSAIEEKAENAFKAYIEAFDDPGIRVARGFTGDDATEPSVTVIAHSSQPTVIDEGPVPTGIRDVSIAVVIRSHNGLPVDDQSTWDAAGVTNARDMHSLLVGRVLDLLFDDDIVVRLNAQAVADLTVQSVYVNERSRQVDGGSFVTTQELVVTCHPAA